MVMENVQAAEEYKGERPGCFKCKLPISEEEDYYRLTWVGKTWEVTMDYHRSCLIEAVLAGDLGGEKPPTGKDV